MDGTLKTHIDQFNTYSIYEYDFIKRPIKKTIQPFDDNIFISETKLYNSFNLLSSTDFDGNITDYKYDYAGRKISETTLNEETKFFYDDLSRLTTSIFVNDFSSLHNIQITDYLDRIIEERKEDQYANILYKIKYEYDSQNNKTKITRYINNQPSTEKFTYDAFNRLTKTEDSLGNISKTKYIEENNILQIIHTDPMNLQTIKTVDALNRLILEEKVYNENLLAKEEFFYDLSNNLTSQKSLIINQENNSHKSSQIKKYYDEMNRVKILIEAYNTPNERETHYSYNKKGLLHQVIKPNKVVLTYEYDYLGNNIRLYSSNSSLTQPIDYEFSYNSLGFITKATNNISQTSTIRDLDHKGRIIKEKLANNLIIRNIYDDIGNKIKQFLPDLSSIEYTYNPLYLKEITRKDNKNSELYKHEFIEYDLNGNSLVQNLINNTTLNQTYDKLGRKVKIENNFFSQTIDSINPDGTIKQMTFSTPHQTDTTYYKYDHLKQLTKEEGLFTRNYLYDSHHNRLRKDDITYEINNLNQIQKTSTEEITYDDNGNPIQNHTLYGDIYYKYDALDRLIYMEKSNDYKLEFEYDAFHRRLTKKYYKYIQGWFSSYWEESTVNYLYDNQNEIASLDGKNCFIELRILGNTENAEIASSISFEINNNIYLPIHDLQGNISAIISTANDIEMYRYSAFGEEQIYFNNIKHQESKLKNYWRFSSKRKDESNLIYFGRRYYDTNYGRWLTPDPKGFTDSLNLYAYVLNDPLIKVDLYGEYANPYMFNGITKNNSSRPEREKSQILPTIGNQYSTNKIFLINGQFNTKNEALENAFFLHQNIKHATNNMGLIPLYTSTRGLIHDTMRTILQKNEFYIPKRVEMIQNALLNHANDLIEKNINTKSFIVSFSRGSLDLHQALKGLNLEQKNKFIIFNLGFSQALSKDQGFIVRNTRTSGDIIPSLMAPFSCCKLEGSIYNIKQTDKYDISLLKHKTGHLFKNQPYQDYLSDNFENYFSNGLKNE